MNFDVWIWAISRLGALLSKKNVGWIYSIMLSTNFDVIILVAVYC